MAVLALYMYPATLACERQHGLAVKTWLDDAAPCAPVGDYEYLRASAQECPIQHYYSTPDVQSVQECAWACDEQPSCVGFAWGVPVGAIAPLRPCSLTESCVAGSRYLRLAKDGIRTSYFKLPRDSHFRNGVPVPSVHQDGTVLSSETTGPFASESTGGQLAYRDDDTPTEGECIVGDSDDLDQVRVHLFETEIGPRSTEEATCLRECAVYPGATGCLTHSTEGCFVYTSTYIAWRALDAQQPAQRCWIFWRGGDVDAGALLRVHQVTGELRAPVSGVYRFQLNSDASLLTALRVTKSLEQDEDPCSGGLELTGGGSIDFGPYEANMACEWTVQCPGGSATMVFTSFETELTHDLVNVDGVEFSGSYEQAFGAADQRGGELFSISGGSSMAVTFSSDHSLDSDGFSADVTCGPARRTCADTNADGTEDDPYDCDQHENSLAADPAGTDCAGDACADADCCTRLPGPCSGGLELTGGGSIDFGPYEANMACEWTVQCPGGSATMVFTSFETELTHDLVNVDGVEFSGSYEQAFGAADQRGGELFSISGGSSMAVTFSSDHSLDSDGFSADVTCGPARRTCADTNADGTEDDPYDCDQHENSLAADPAGTDCAGDACVDADCCTVAAVCDTLWDQGVHECPAVSYSYSSRTRSAQFVRVADHTTCATHYFEERGNSANTVAKCAQKCAQNDCAFFTLFQDPSGTNRDYGGTGHDAYCRLHTECDAATRIDPAQEDSTVGPAPDGSAGSGGEDLTSPVGVPCWLYQRTEG